MPWTKGESGNPKGRPRKKKSLTEILERYAKKRDVEFNGKLISRKEAIARKLWNIALGGDIQAIRYIYDRIDGRPDQPLDLHHDFSDDLALNIIINRGPDGPDSPPKTG